MFYSSFLEEPAGMLPDYFENHVCNSEIKPLSVSVGVIAVQPLFSHLLKLMYPTTMFGDHRY